MKKLIYKAMTAASLACMATPALAQQISSRATAPLFQTEETPVTTPADLAGYSYGYVGAPTAYDPGPSPEYAGYIVQNEEPYTAPANDDIDIAPATTKVGCSEAMSCCQDCCEPFWAHRTGAFFDFLYLRPRNADVAYALPRNGVNPATAVPYGGVATANPNFGPGFRIGGIWAIDRCSSFRFAYTYFQSIANGSVFANPPLTVHSLVTDPHTYTTASDSLASLSRYNIRFQLVDFDYRRLIAAGANWSLNYSVGTRYAHLSQFFRESQPIGPGSTNVGSNINFDGGGARVGLLGQRKAYNRGFLLYGRGFADMLVGNFRSSYLQVNNFQQTQVWSSWKSFRTVPMLEFELGAGWISRDGRFQFRGGYYFASWFNTVTTANYIQSVQTNNYVGVGNAITFDGLVLRGQYNW